jgi:hypothetical protein
MKQQKKCASNEREEDKREEFAVKNVCNKCFSLIMPHKSHVEISAAA